MKENTYRLTNVVLKNSINGSVGADEIVKIAKEFAMNYAHWLNNNWFIPTEDGEWMLDTDNINFSRTIPGDKFVFEEEELMSLYFNGHGDDAEF